MDKQLKDNIRHVKECDFLWSDGSLETLYIGTDSYVLKPQITREEYKGYPEEVQDEYVLIEGKEGLLLYTLKTDLPKVKSVKRSRERITRKGNVAQGISHPNPKPKGKEEGQSTEHKRENWRLPSYTVYLSEIDQSKHKACNKYLMHMQNRIRKEIKRGNEKYAARLGLILIQRSRVFLTYVLVRTCKGYFWKLKEMDVWANLNRYMKFVRNMDYRITVKRYYIPKKNNKFRPIGAPVLWTKLVLKALEIVMRELIQHKIGKYQHGFMQSKGCQTASTEVIERLRDNPDLKVFEFDLHAFFNKVNPIRVCSSLEADYGPIGDWIRAISTGSIPSIPIKNLKPEHELVYKFDDADRSGRRKKLLHRFGFTQGSPLSPLLCAYALEIGKIGGILGLTMYADDGLILTRGNPEIKELLGTFLLKLGGIRLASDKPWGETKKFKFLGLTYNLEERQVWYVEADGTVQNMINLDTASDTEIAELVKYSKYVERSDRDRRVIAKDSMVGRTSWLEYHISRIALIYKTAINFSTTIGGMRNWLRTIESAPKGEGWNDSWCSTVMALEMCSKLEIRGDLRKSGNYMLPPQLRGFSNIIKTTHTQNYRNFRYDVIERSDQEGYYNQHDTMGFIAWDEDTNSYKYHPYAIPQRVAPTGGYTWHEYAKKARQNELTVQGITEGKRLKYVVSRYWS